MPHRTYKRANETRVCDVCGKKVGMKKYDQHLERCRVKAEGGEQSAEAKASERTFCCEMCGRQFSGRHAHALYSTHKKKTHFKTEVCPICGYREDIQRYR